MLRSSIQMLVMVFATCSAAIAQELHEWKSKTGHTTEASFLKIDETNRKVTLLIPKVIDFDKLDEDSIALARKLAAAATKVDDESTSILSQESDEMRFLREKYDALSRFKTTPDFVDWGFAIGGPYGSWLKEVEKSKKANSFESRDVAFAIGHLLTLGLEYKDSKGKETEYARFANECIKGILDGQSKDEFEKRALAKIESIMSGKSRSESSKQVQQPANRPPNAEYKYVQDDFYPDIYAFRSVVQLKHYWDGKKQSPTLTSRELDQLGIELVESKTKVRILNRIPFQSATIFEVEPTSGRQKGKRLFVISLDVYDQIR